jgi:lysophospholipase L1-like esterase
MRKNRLKRTPVMLAVASLLASLVVFVSSGTASATSDYDNLIHTSPSLYVYTDGAAKSQKMDISASWLDDLGQTYAKRQAQGLGWPSNLMSELHDIKASGGSLGVVMHQDSNPALGITVEIFGTRDPDAYCEFTGSAATGGFGCTAHPGFGYVSVEYFTHNSFGGNGCGWWWANQTCSDNGMNIYMSPSVVSGNPNYAYQVKWIQNTEMPNYMFYYMDFDITYPTGYDGVRIPTQQPNATYVAMGDSFSAGEGIPPFETNTDVGGTNENRCHRSSKAYPRLLEFDSSLNLGSTAFVACSGATTNTVRNGGSAEGSWGEGPQIAALTQDTKVVTITIGGNDVGFKDFATACTVASCDFATTAYSDIHGKITSELPGKLADVYEAIDNATSSNADIYVVGYPQITPAEMPTGMNSACYPFNSSGVDNPDPELNDGATAYAVVTELNSVIHSAVNAMNSSKFHFVDPNLPGSPFIGHDWCKQDRYFDQIGVPVPGSNTEYSYHPNEGGQAAYSAVVRSEMN